MYPLAMLVLGGYNPVFFILSVFVTLYVCFMHRSNIKRLLNGTESKFKPKKN
jgi:glycerol-3-phosphate acyltransferase PlsY